MHIAVASGHTDIVKLLLAKGAYIEARDHEYQTPLLIAAASGHTAIMKVLLKNVRLTIFVYLVDIAIYF